jgi:hypothetical protein
LEDVKGQTVTIFVETSVLGFDEFFPKAETVVQSSPHFGRWVFS